MVESSPIPKIPLLLFGSALNPNLQNEGVSNKVMTENTKKARELLCNINELS